MPIAPISDSGEERLGGLALWLDETIKAPLPVFLLYRLGLSGGLVLLYVTGLLPGNLGRYLPGLFGLASIAYLGFALAGLLVMRARALKPEAQSYLAVFVDIIAISLMMHASGGVQSGLGMLLAVSIAVGSLMMRGRLALLFASLASLAILTEQTAVYYEPLLPGPSFTHAALLGIALFAIALLAHSLSLHIRAGERLASRQKLDLANLSQLNQYVVEHMRTGIVVVDLDEHIRLLNSTAWYLLGMPQAREGSLLEQACQPLADQLNQWRQDPESERPMFRAVSSGRDLRANFTALGKEQAAGTLVFVEDTANISEQAQQMKLASIGQLTASIAHEIRNPLGAISHAAQLLAESPSLAEPDQRLTEIIRGNSARVNQIIENVLQLSRRGRARPRDVSLQALVEDYAAKLLQEHRLEDSQLTWEIEPADTTVFVDPAQVEQILAILCANAITHFHTDPGQLHLFLVGGITRDTGGPFLDVMDNGPGIPTDVARRIFEPFFTTRNAGTGLGLYIARELGEANRLRLEYQALPRGGSRFRISFATGRGKEKSE